MNRIRKTTLIPFALLVGSLIVISFCSIANAATDSFIGNSDNTGSTSGGPSGHDGPGSGSCSVDGGMLECAGLSWIYYEYVGGKDEASLNNADIYFPEEYDWSDAKLERLNYKIPNSCAKAGGFWHYGRNARARQTAWSSGGFFGTTYRNRLNQIGSQYTYRASEGSWGHLLTSTRYYEDVTNGSWYHGDKDSRDPWNQISYNGRSNGIPVQEIWKGSQKLYEAKRYATYTRRGEGGTEATNVYLAYAKAYKIAAGRTYREEEINHHTYAFCWGENMGGGKFSGNVTARANGQTGSIVTVTSDTFTLSFDHNIKRNQDAYSVTATNNYNITIRDANGQIDRIDNQTRAFPPNNTQFSNVWPWSRQMTSPLPGSQTTYCSTMFYSDDFDEQGKGGDPTARAEACITVKRSGGGGNAGDFTAGIRCLGWGNGESKGEGCISSNNTEGFKTNSKNWTMRHEGLAYTNVGWVGTVPAGTESALDAKSPYTHGPLSYGVSSNESGSSPKCIRSRQPYTQFWFGHDGSWTASGPTLYNTGEKDLPERKDGTNDYKVLKREGYYEPYRYCTYQPGGYYSDENCTNNVGPGNGSYNLSEGQRWVEPEYETHYWYDGCGTGNTTWRDFAYNNADNGARAEWSGNNDSSLLLSNNPTGDTVSVERCSTMVVNSKWTSPYGWLNATDSPTGDYRSTANGCSKVTRYRRHIHFSGNAAAIKADAGNEAKTARNNMDEINVTSTDGKFTVTFVYSINRDDTTNVMDTGAQNYPVTNEWGSFETIAPYETNANSTIYGDNGTYNVYHNYGAFPSTQQGEHPVKSAGINPETVSGTLYYGQVVKICGNLRYGNSVREIDDGSEIESWAEGEVGCVIVRRDEQNCGNVVNKGEMGYSFSHLEGYNVARIGVINSSLMSSPVFTKFNDFQAHVGGPAVSNADVWARPGDTVQYQINYCMGANYAHAVHLYNHVQDGGVDTIMKMKGDSKAYRTEDTNNLSQTTRDHYLFGDSVSKYKQGITTPEIFNFIKRTSSGEIDKDKTLVDENTKNDLTSPQGVGTIYSCPIKGGNTNGTDDHYQIAGKVKKVDGKYVIDGCTTNRTQSLDVGRELSEDLQWTDMQFHRDVTKAIVNSNDYISRAHIQVPYNYIAKPYITISNSPKGTVQIGGKMTTTPGIAVFPRKNCALADGYNLKGCEGNNSNNATYATVTKPTTVKLEAYVNNESRIFQADSYVVRANTKSIRNGSAGKLENGNFQDGTLNDGGTQFDENYSVDVPNDVNPGDKICVKMTITPADSHNKLSSSTVYGSSQSATGAEDTSKTEYTYWALREDGTTSAVAISCSTAVKRPTISIEDSNLYSASNITTSVVSRNNYTSGGIRHANNGTKYYLFGSWSEYGIFGKVATGTDNGVNISTLGTASGASLGYSQTSYLNSHKTTVTGYNAQPLTVVTYNGGPKNGTYEYNYSRITRNSSQTRIVYEYETKEDGSRYYRLASKTNQTIAPSSYTFANSPIVNAADSRGVASKATKVCTHSTQTFANVDCDDGKIGSTKVGADAVDVFTTNILDRYGDAKMPYTKTDGAEVINGYTNLTETSAVAEQLDGDEGAAMFKNIKGKAFLGYKDGHAVDYDSLAVKNNGNIEGVNTNLTAKSVMVYKADTVVINSSLIANNDEKTGSGDFRMPIIIANKVWFTGNPTRVDAIIIAKEELNTCKWNSYNDFLSNVLPSFPTKKNNLASNKANEMSSNICNNELRFTAPVVVKGKLVLNRTYGAGGANNGGDQIRRAEIFELNAATYLWSFAEMSRYSQAITTYSRELPSRY